MRNKTKLLLRIGLLIIFFSFLAVYGYSKTKNLIIGAKISIKTIENGQTVTNPFLNLVGVTKNTAYLTLNDRKIFIDQAGNFQESLLLNEGYNIITIKAKDKFNKETQKDLKLVLRSPVYSSLY